MWSILRPFREQGWHFRREVAIGPYYADFACLHAKLVIEVDGESHRFEAVAAGDEIRDEYMASRGIHVLRIPNYEVLDNPDGVMAYIAGILESLRRASNTPTPVPSPQGGGGRKPRRPRQPRTRLPKAEAPSEPGSSDASGGPRGRRDV
jgi:very-short-patch-repair endonuclease